MLRLLSSFFADADGDIRSQNTYNSIDSLIHPRAMTTQHLGRSQYHDLHERRNTLSCLSRASNASTPLPLLMPPLYFLEVKSVSRSDEPLFSERPQVQASSDRLPQAHAEEGSLFSVTAFSQAGGLLVLVASYWRQTWRSK